MIKFKKIRYKNFFSIGNYPIEVDLIKNKNTLIIGTNGVGKSTFVSAICYALYGEPYKKVLKGTMVNSINKKDMLVEIEFNIGDDEYLIKRGMKPNIFEIHMNNVLLNVDPNVDYQINLEKNILKMSFHTFKQIVVIGNSGFVPFLKLPAGDRRKMIDDILDLGILSKMTILLKEEIQTTKKEKEFCDRSLFENEVRMKSENEKLQFLLEHSKNEDKEKRKIIETQIKTKQINLDKYPKEFPNLEEKQREYEYVKRKIDTKHVLLENEISTTKKEIDLLGCGTCPTCKQNISNEFREFRLKELQTNVNTTQNTLEKIYTVQNTIKTKMSENSLKIQKMNQLIMNKNKLEYEIESLISQLKNLKTTDSSIDTNIIENEKIKLEEQKNNLLKTQHEILKKIENLNKALIVLKDDGAKSKIIRTYIPLVNQYINEYLDEMNFYVSFEIDENFEETIKSRYRDVFTYENFSDGEKARIDLAFLFAWRKISKHRNGISTNLLILDEVFSGSLDSNGINDLHLILENLENSNVFVITHRIEEAVDKFESVIEFTKNKNFTNINRKQ